MKLSVNGDQHELDVEPAMPLLWALREELRITGPKYGCGVGYCGACSVWVDGALTRSCVTPVGAVSGAVLTIEGVERHESPQAKTLQAVQRAWIEQQVAQCGYCQSGQIMTAAALLVHNPSPADAEIDQAMAANLCRCGTYPRIRAAVRSAANALKGA